MTSIELARSNGVLVALDEILESWLEGMPYDLRPPRPSQFPHPIDVEDAKHLVDLVTRYPAFQPPLSDEDRDAVLLDLIATSTADRIPFEAALSLEELGQPAVRVFLRRIVTERRMATAGERFETFLSYLLDDLESRPTITEEFTRASGDPLVQSMAKSLAVELDEDES